MITRLIELLLSVDWQGVLELTNVVLASGIVIVSFGFLLYILVYSSRHDVARPFSALLACVLVTYFVDIALFGASDAQAAATWLRVQWLGIAFTPPAYLQFSNALLMTTGAHSRVRDLGVRIAYFLSALLLVAAAFGALLGHRISISTSVETARGRSVIKILSSCRAWRVCQSPSVTATPSRTTCNAPKV